MQDVRLVGLGRFELPTSRLSGVRSNQLSYRPVTHRSVTGHAATHGDGNNRDERPARRQALDR